MASRQIQLMHLFIYLFDHAKILEHAKSQNCFQKRPRQRLFKDTLIARQRLHRRDRVETAVSADLVWSREMRVRRSIFRRGDIFMALELSYALNKFNHDFPEEPCFGMWGGADEY